MVAASRTGGRMFLAIAARLLVTALAVLATTIFSYLLLHPDSTGSQSTPPASVAPPHP
ncbi:hypothetical protein [Nocardia sp. NPDC052566]|uniref:hypothetical protein n=1 Tax=Nocardia sp. NPDC052566 TaxID=3364330 RepID=UPI0037C964F1